MIFTAQKDEQLTFSVLPPIYHPYRNISRINAYYTYAPFDHDPFKIWALSTSGSPVILAAQSFFGFMDDQKGGRFAYDGCGKLTVTVPEGQSLYYEETCAPYKAWQSYSALIRAAQEPHEDQPFWSNLEYCTWVDQKAEGLATGIGDHGALTEEFVYKYMARVKALGLPTGKLTIDDGWDLRYPKGVKVVGNWQIDRQKFPHMEQLVKDMKKEGFIPGLWFCPFNITPNSDLAQKYPALLGSNWNPSVKEVNPDSLMFIRPVPALMGVLEDYYRSVFSPYIAMGFQKFKLDMSYAAKDEMKTLLALIYRIIKELDPTVEVEAHVPDIFLSRYCDTVRLNDVDLDAAGKWREVTYEHYKVCKFSAFDRILNFDHIGANTPDPDPVAFMQHTDLLFSLSGGYPCISFLPDRFEDKTIAKQFATRLLRFLERKLGKELSETKGYKGVTLT